MKLKREYNNIVNKYINNDYFLLLKNDNHHGTNKYDHCIRVSYLSFILSKVFKANFKEATVSGLLHDFFYGLRTSKKENSYLNHPYTSASNAKKIFNVNKNEAEIIKTHMYHHAIMKKILPFINREECKRLKEYKPNSKEGVIVCISDMLVSIFELLTYKISYSICLYFIFALNFKF